MLADYRSAAFDEAAERVATARNDRSRRIAVDRQLQLLAKELPAVPLLFGGGTFAYRDAAYDRWVSVPGTGILDKRSFLRGAVPAAASRQPPVSDLIDRSGDGGISLVPIIAVLLVLTAGGGLWWMRRRA